MNPTQTGIAVAVALAVIIFFFVFGGTAFFAGPPPQDSAAAVAPAVPSDTGDQNPLTAPAPSGDVTQLQATDEVVGTGATAAAGDTVTVNYIGALTDGTVFDASANHGSSGFTFALGGGQVIKGWDEGLIGMREGGKRRLVIPPDLAYGNQAVGNVIPANATLIFEVELVKVQKP